MIYIDKNFRFYDDSKDLETFPELKPTPDATALSDEEVKAITADITKWKWHPTDLKPYKIPGCETKYTKIIDDVILEMTVEEKAAVDQAEADALAAKLAAEQAAAEAAALAQAELDAKIAAIADAKAAIASLVPAVDKATDIEGLKKVVLDLIKNVQAITA